MSTVKKEAATAKRPVHKKKITTTTSKRTTGGKKKAAPPNKKFPVQLKVALAGIVLILLSPFYYAYVIKFFASTGDG